MTDELSIVTKPHDYSDIAHLQYPSILEEFLEQPLTYIAETVTGALAVGKTGTMVAGGRIVQALLKGKVFQQFGKEFKKLREAGKIPDDFAEKRYGFQTWVELMSIIDEESPDADRLDALKAMFYEVNKINPIDGEQIAAYHLWQIVKGLSSGEILLLKTAFEQRDKYHNNQILQSEWKSSIAESIGHHVYGLIDLHEKKLIELGLLSERLMIPTMYRVEGKNARLTDLGIRVCENIKNYQSVLDEINSNLAPE